jgi:hypothetical protein
MQYEYKNAEFDADFESVEKQRKILGDKSKKSKRKMEFFTIITMCKFFRPLTF